MRVDSPAKCKRAKSLLSSIVQPVISLLHDQNHVPSMTATTASSQSGGCGRSPGVRDFSREKPPRESAAYSQAQPSSGSQAQRPAAAS
mgnify:CR=1 FL=1